jgi:hypothetical protein
MAARADVPRALLRWGLGEIRGLTFCGRRLRFRSDVSSRQALGLRLLKTRGRQERHPNWPMLRSRKSRNGLDHSSLENEPAGTLPPTCPKVLRTTLRTNWKLEENSGAAIATKMPVQRGSGFPMSDRCRSGIMVDAAEDLQELEYFHIKSRTSPSRKGTV